MPERKEVLRLKNKVPYEIEIVEKDIKTGKNRWGRNWYLWTVKMGDKEYSFFPSEILRNLLNKYKEGDVVRIRKKIKNIKGRYQTIWDVEHLQEVVK